VNVGLLGYGTIAAEHARALSAEGCRLVAVAGPRAERAAAFAAEHGVERVAPGVEELVAADDVEAVVIASPNALHAGQALLALEQRKHVLCEVPLALSQTDAERVTAAAGASGRRFLVCQTQRFLAPLLRVRAETASRPIRHVIVRLVLSRTTNVGITGRPRSWTDDIVWHHGSHALDTALWLLGGDVEEVVALGAGESEGGTPLDAGIVLRTRAGGLATIALSYTAETPSTDVLVHCDGASYRVEGAAFQDAFADAVRRQDAHFLDLDTPASPAPQALAELYRTLQLVSDRLTP
jgi:2-hydroxy-4-carboxymuconate semialdehyde hemiacetal dehydrogenase